MKTISAKVSEPEKIAQRIHSRASLAALKPLNLGRTLRPLSRRNNLLGEMLK
jgi:hypothetical protein